jgi:hypothetical protein
MILHILLLLVEMVIEQALMFNKKGEISMKDHTNRVVNFFKENESKFTTKRQASKYLNHYGKVWKEEHDISLTDKKRS